jgi:hypothetical protein
MLSLTTQKREQIVWLHNKEKNDADKKKRITMPSAAHRFIWGLSIDKFLGQVLRQERVSEQHNHVALHVQSNTKESKIGRVLWNH